MLKAGSELRHCCHFESNKGNRHAMKWKLTLKVWFARAWKDIWARQGGGNDLLWAGYRDDMQALRGRESALLITITSCLLTIWCHFLSPTGKIITGTSAFQMSDFGLTRLRGLSAAFLRVEKCSGQACEVESGNSFSCTLDLAPAHLNFLSRSTQDEVYVGCHL